MKAGRNLCKSGAWKNSNYGTEENPPLRTGLWNCDICEHHLFLYTARFRRPKIPLQCCAQSPDFRTQLYRRLWIKKYQAERKDCMGRGRGCFIPAPPIMENRRLQKVCQSILQGKLPGSRDLVFILPISACSCVKTQR